MAKCAKTIRQSKRVCIGALNRQIGVYFRDITTPTSGSVDFGENFSGEKIVWSLVNTTSGKKMFDDTNIERNVTHQIYIRYLADMTPERWVRLFSVNSIEPNVYLDILDVQNLNEENRFYLLNCSIRGKDSVSVNWA